MPYSPSDLWNPDFPPITKLFATMRLVVPKSMYEETLTDYNIMNPNAQIFASPLLRQVVFSVTNNFAGLGAFSMEQVLLLLQKNSNMKFLQLISQAPTYSAQAFVQNVFKCAIEVGDARIVDLLLAQKAEFVDVNRQPCIMNGTTYTPINRARYLDHQDVVEVLLKHGADDDEPSWDSDEPRRLKDALDFAAESTKRSRCESQDFWLRAFADSWIKDGRICEAIYELEEHTAMSVIMIMLDIGTDLNHITCKYPGSVIDAAAKRGSCKMVRFLLHAGAYLTPDTLPIAISSGNEDLIYLLLERGADVKASGSSCTPLSAAIHLQNERVLEVIKAHGAMEALDRPKHLSTAFRAAICVMNKTVIEDLISNEVKSNPQDLGQCLTLAIQAGLDEISMRCSTAAKYSPY